jgi:hypothetical protein
MTLAPPAHWPLLLQRLAHMAVGWGGVGVAYNLARHLQGPASVVIPETVVDRAIAFSPDGIWLYLSFFLLIPCAYLFAESRRLAWISRSMLACAFVCGIFYLACPTTLVYPEVTGETISATVLRQLAASDSTQNCLPSLHGALSLLAIWSLMPRRDAPWAMLDFLRAAFFLLWGGCIAFAVIQTRRHLALDFSAGLIVGWLSGCAVQMLDRAHARRLLIDSVSTGMPHP